MSFLFILAFVVGSVLCNAMRLGGYRDVHDLYPIEAMIAGMESDIETLLLSEGVIMGDKSDNDVDDDDDIISVISAQSQVVAGTNYRVSLYVGFEGEESKFVVVQFFVDLPANDPSQTPKDLKLVKGPSKMVGSDASLYGAGETHKEEKKRDDDPYHNEKYQSQYAYEDKPSKGVDGAAGIDGRLYGGANCQHGWCEVSKDHMAAVRETISAMDSDIRALLLSEGMSVGRDDPIVPFDTPMKKGNDYMVAISVWTKARPFFAVIQYSGRGADLKLLKEAPWKDGKFADKRLFYSIAETDYKKNDKKEKKKYGVTGMDMFGWYGWPRDGA